MLEYASTCHTHCLGKPKMSGHLLITGRLYSCRYVTPGGFRESALVAGLSQDALDSMESKVRARMRLYRPGGQMACELAKNPTVLIVNDSVFAHGGVLAQHGELAHSLQDAVMPEQV